MSMRQMVLSFESSEATPQTTEQPRQTGGELAASLRPRVLALLRDTTTPVGIHELRHRLGYPALDTDPHPQSNPVNRILKEMRDAGEIVCNEPERGEPSFALPATEDKMPATVQAGQQAERFLELFTVGDAVEFDIAGADRFGEVVAVDDAFNNATVQLIPSGEQMTVSQDLLSKVMPDPLAHDDRDVATIEITHAEGDVSVWRQSDGTWLSCEETRAEAREEARFVLTAADNGAEWAGRELDRNRGALQTQHPEVAAKHGVGTDVDRASRASPSEGVDALTPDRRPYTLEQHREFLARVRSGEMTAKQLRDNFSHLSATRDAFVEDLLRHSNAATLKEQAHSFGVYGAKRQTKVQNAEAIVRAMLQQHCVGKGVSFNPMAERFEDGVCRVVESITDEDIAALAAEIAANRTATDKALTNPETLDEFRTFIRHNGAAALSHEQRVAYDRLQADATRQRRAEERRPTTVEQVRSDVEGLQIDIKEGWHDKRQCSLWICQLSERVDRDVFTELKVKAKQLGGWYSSFKKDDAGFQFTEQGSAEKFLQLLSQSVDRSDELAARSASKKETAASRLTELAHDLETRANQLLEHGHTTLQNTVRRSEMAAGIRGRAYAQLAFVGTMRSLATDLATGKAMYLDGIRTMTQLETLIDLARRSKRKRNEQMLAERGELGMWDRHRAVEDADVATYPYPVIYKRHLQEAVAASQRRRGVVQAARRMRKRIDRHADEFVAFKTEAAVDALADFCSRCKAAGASVEWIERELEVYKRLRAANIHTLPELRMALRELVPHLQKKRDDDPVLKAEQALIGKDLPGFYPTPKAVISRMLEFADIRSQHRVLEPSAGKGDILDMLAEHHPDADVTAIELNGTLFDVLSAKGHGVERGDFLEHGGQYDRVVMNPPFENGRDIEHVRHAYDRLVAGGRLVSIMSEGPFFRSDRQALEFREWFDDVGGQSEQLPEDAFAGSDAFRQTDVRTRIVHISK